MSLPMLEHFHCDPSSCSYKLKLPNFPPGVSHGLRLTCFPLPHTLAVLNSPSEHESHFISFAAFATPLLSEYLPGFPTGWTHYPVQMTVRHRSSQVLLDTSYLNRVL